MPEKQIHSGHRKRIDEKSRLMGLEFLEEHEQLEKILFAVIPRGNTNETAHRLLERFGSLYGVLTADAEKLKEVDGIGGRVAEFLHDLPEIAGIVSRSAMNRSGAVVLDNDEKMCEYIKSLFFGKVIEYFYTVFLNSARQVIRFDKISDGCAASVDVSLHKITRLAVSTNAREVILAHNHPGGVPSPSYADCALTKSVDEALKAVGIKLCGHFIVAGGQCIKIEHY